MLIVIIFFAGEISLEFFEGTDDVDIVWLRKLLLSRSANDENNNEMLAWIELQSFSIACNFSESNISSSCWLIHVLKEYPESFANTLWLWYLLLYVLFCGLGTDCR